jgi:hypothetical protein
MSEALGREIDDPSSLLRLASGAVAVFLVGAVLVVLARVEVWRASPSGRSRSFWHFSRPSSHSRLRPLIQPIGGRWLGNALRRKQGDAGERTAPEMLGVPALTLAATEEGGVLPIDEVRSSRCPSQAKNGRSAPTWRSSVSTCFATTRWASTRRWVEVQPRDGRAEPADVPGSYAPPSTPTRSSRSTSFFLSRRSPRCSCRSRSIIGLAIFASRGSNDNGSRGQAEARALPAPRPQVTAGRGETRGALSLLTGP